MVVTGPNPDKSSKQEPLIRAKNGEFRGDFTRDRFDPQQEFLRVFMQQGRVQLDADWNEQVSILLHYLQTLAADLIGPYGGPGSADSPETGFGITLSVNPSSNTIENLIISPGRYYVDGILCELSVGADEKETTGKEITYSTQPNYPLSPKENEDLKKHLSDSFLVYLDVWERHLTCIEDETICDVALNGIDTTTRAKVICQVRILNPQNLSSTLSEKQKEAIKEGFKTLKKSLESAQNEKKLQDFLNQNFHPFWNRDIVELLLQPQNRGLLRAQAMKNETQDNPCLIHPDARYRGPENQLYRVEIHQGGSADKATFKWSRENGSVAFPLELKNDIADTATDVTVKLKSWWRDDRLGLAQYDWVELVDDTIALQQWAEPLWQVTNIDPIERLVTLKRNTGGDHAINTKQHPLLRRWDQKIRLEQTEGNPALAGSPPGENGAIRVQEDTKTWITLEDGVQIQFAPPKLKPVKVEMGSVVAEREAVPSASEGRGSAVSISRGSEVKHTYRTGDYWLIPARTASGDVIWPSDKGSKDKGDPKALPPHGVWHHYAPLAIVISAQKDGCVDCRLFFDPLTKTTPTTS